MLTVKEWMELVEYRITEGDSYGWSCFGDKAFSLSAWNGDQDGWSMNMVFDTDTQTVYTVEVCDYARDRAYRVINPDYKIVHDREAQHRGENARQAWDDVNYIDLEDDDDFIQKGLAIKADEDYDTRVSVPLTVPDDVLFELMKRAHDRDITLNKMVEEILLEAIENTRIDGDLQEEIDDLEDKLWDDLVEDDHWDDDIIEDEEPKKKKRKKSK
jgi:hypothetical protein